MSEKFEGHVPPQENKEEPKITFEKGQRVTWNNSIGGEVIAPKVEGVDPEGNRRQIDGIVIQWDDGRTTFYPYDDEESYGGLAPERRK